MKKLIPLSFAATLLIFLTFCKGPDQPEQTDSNTHKGVALEILQTTSYTYLLLEENDISQWVAVPKMEALVGETYVYQDGQEMIDFKSTQLGRTFESVLFLQGVMNANLMERKMAEATTQTTGASTTVEKVDVQIDPVEGGISIQELFSNKEQYKGKVVRVKGKVTKFNESIMGKNWIHLQDGSEHNGEFDLVVTSMEIAKVGSIIVAEGIIAIDKDFGYGYFFNVIMEESKIVE
jgi:hypothetical protein